MNGMTREEALQLLSTLLYLLQRPTPDKYSVNGIRDALDALTASPREEGACWCGARMAHQSGGSLICENLSLFGVHLTDPSVPRARGGACIPEGLTPSTAESTASGPSAPEVGDLARCAFSDVKGVRYEVKLWRLGQLLSHTWHTSESSRDIEVEVCKDRINKGEATHVETWPGWAKP